MINTDRTTFTKSDTAWIPIVERSKAELINADLFFIGQYKANTDESEVDGICPIIGNSR